MIITCKKLVFAPGAQVINKGAVAINKGIILSIGPADSIISKYPRYDVYRLHNAVLLPGLVNLHAHLELPPLRVSIRTKSLPDWVLNLIRVKKKISLQDYAHAASKNIDALVRSGTTCIGEICTHGMSPSLLEQSGLRAVVFQELISMYGHTGNTVLPPLAKSGRNRLMHYGLSPHAPYTVAKHLLLKIKELSERKPVHIAMHIAESKDEIKLLQRGKSGLEKLYQFAGWDLTWAPTGKSSFEYLNRIGFLSPHLLAVHAVHVTDRDIKLIRKTKVSVAHCPRSNKGLGVGRMPLGKLLKAGITVGLGTDSLASVPTLSMWDEMRYAYKIHKSDGISAEDIFGLATIGGARALGLDKEIGTLEMGKKADIIAVPLPNKNTGDLYSDLLRETKSCIMSVVNGKILFKEG